jgi:DNA-3-methyladenine glycosylase
VAAAFGIDRTHSGLDLLDPRSPLRVEPAEAGDRPPALEWTPRVGIAYAGEPWTERRWRLMDTTSPSVSGQARRGRPNPGS